ncbi:alanine racemase [Marivita geojedonensis]|uniref:alanine racemase n=1 Tax=Marivita geojedonensis TaxID=1123756 RepID=UPI000D4138E6|nr:alanine racemase [Marivita geojedonensis]PRY77983.1 putative amino acid racemase [Marivita geojedonensis]
MLDINTISGPRVEFDTDALQQNFAHLAKLCAAHGIAVSGVTKAIGGNPDIARLMLDNGIRTLADARLDNIARLRAGGIDVPVMLLRAPAMVEVAEAARLADIFLLSEIETIRALATAKAELGKCCQVVLMVDLGDLREGVPPEDLPSLGRAVMATENANIIGIGTNLACNLGVLPDQSNMAELVALANQLEATIGHPLRYVSAGNSSAISLMLNQGLPSKINHLRLGESLLLGRETAYGHPLARMSGDCFDLVAQIIEHKLKAPRPYAARGRNAFGQQVDVELTEPRRLGVLNVGAVDCEIGGLCPLINGVSIVGYSSDHLIVDTTSSTSLAVGDEIRFRVDYHALATAMTSPYLAQVAFQANSVSFTLEGAPRCLPLR